MFPILSIHLDHFDFLYFHEHRKLRSVTLAVCITFVSSAVLRLVSEWRIQNAPAGAVIVDHGDLKSRSKNVFRVPVRVFGGFGGIFW